MSFTLLDIPCAGTWKRDCELTSLEITPKLCLEFTKEEDKSEWKLEFDNIVAFKLTSEEFAGQLFTDLPEEGSFYIYENSPWLKSLKRYEKDELIESCKHFVLFFYDEVVEVVARELSYDKLNQNPHNTNKEHSPKTKSELSSFIHKMSQDYRKHPDSWPNKDLGIFLDALAAWIDDIEGYYLNHGKPTPDKPDWEMIADMLSAAKVYE